MDIKSLSLIEIQSHIQSGDLTSDQVYTYFRDRVLTQNESLGAFTTLPSDTPP